VTVAAAGVTIVNGNLSVTSGTSTIFLDSINGLKVSVSGGNSMLLTSAQVYITGTGVTTQIVGGSVLLSATVGLYQYSGTINGFAGEIYISQNSGYKVSLKAGDASTSTAPSITLTQGASQAVLTPTGLVVSGGIGATGFNPFVGGTQYYGVTSPANFTTADGKTVTVRGGAIVSIV
jgi:hypothetical protein